MLPFPLSPGKPGVEAILDMLLRGTMDGLTLTTAQCMEVRDVLVPLVTPTPSCFTCHSHDATTCDACIDVIGICKDCGDEANLCRRCAERRYV